MLRKCKHVFLQARRDSMRLATGEIRHADNSSNEPMVDLINIKSAAPAVDKNNAQLVPVEASLVRNQARLPRIREVSMSDNYLVKSGARDLLTNAVAELLAVRPRMPLHFLAAQFNFQVNANKVIVGADILRASHPNKASFRDAMTKVFQSLGTPSSNSKSIAAGDGGDGAILGGSKVSASNPASSNLSTTNAAATASRPSKANTAESTQQPATTKKASLDRSSNPTMTLLHRRDFTKLLEVLCEDLPKALQQRTWDALQVLYETETVSFAEFQRSVQVCLLLEQLLDVVEDLFHAMDQSESGEIQASTLLLVFEAAAAAAPQSQQTGNNGRNDVLLLLKEFMMPSVSGGSSNGNVTNRDTTAVTEHFDDRTLRKSDLINSIFHLAFHP